MRKGILYLVAITDWHTRRVLAWRTSNSLEADFFPRGRLLHYRLPAMIEALNETNDRFGPRAILNTDRH